MVTKINKNQVKDLESSLLTITQDADNTTAQTIPTGATYTKATAFNTAGKYRGVTLDAANNKINLS